MTVPNYIDGNKNNLRTTEAQTVQKLKNNESAKIYWFCKKKKRCNARATSPDGYSWYDTCTSHEKTLTDCTLMAVGALFPKYSNVQVVNKNINTINHRGRALFLSHTEPGLLINNLSAVKNCKLNGHNHGLAVYATLKYKEILRTIEAEILKKIKNVQSQPKN